MYKIWVMTRVGQESAKSAIINRKRPKSIHTPTKTM